jgi:hypothetical protein
LTAIVAGLTGAWSPCGFSMVDTIGSALGDVRRATTLIACATFTIGCLLGGAVTFGGLAFAGHLIGSHAGVTRDVLGATLALAAAIADWRGLRITPQIRRQVPERWRWIMPLPLACGLYGVLLGLGFTTFVLAFATWALAGISFAGGSIAAGIEIGVGFGFGRALPVLFMAPGVRGGQGARRLDDMAAEPRLWLGLRRLDAMGLALCALLMGGSGVSAAQAAALTSATDPSAAGDELAWEQVNGLGMLRSGSGAVVTLPGTFPALGPATVAWYAAGSITVAASPSLVVTTTVPVAHLTALAVSEGWVVYRHLEPDGRESLDGLSLYAPQQSRHLAGPLPAGEIGRPSIDGSAVVFTVDTPTSSVIELTHLPSDTSRILRSSTRDVQLLNPTLRNRRIAYEQTNRCAQELLVGSAERRGGDRVLLTLPSTVARDPGYEQAYEHAYNSGSICPNRRTGPGGSLTLGATAMSGSRVYVTEYPQVVAGARIISVRG